MNVVRLVIICAITFLVTGYLAYFLETIFFRYIGKIGRYETLWKYFRKIDQKNGNITAAVWAAIWIFLIILAALFIYIAS